MDGDLDLVSASSGDHTVAVYIDVDRGRFCEIKRVVDDRAFGVRTAIAADIDGDGDMDLASASKDDHTVAWYPNDGSAGFGEKRIISNASFGAYSLVARDVESDGDMDLIVASNGDDTVAIWRASAAPDPGPLRETPRLRRPHETAHPGSSAAAAGNDGTGRFARTVVYASADFVLSVTAFDFDRDGVSNQWARTLDVALADRMRAPSSSPRGGRTSTSHRPRTLTATCAGTRTSTAPAAAGATTRCTSAHRATM
jgi:hypothetical protein